MKTNTGEKPSRTTSTLSPGSRAARQGTSLKWGLGGSEREVCCFRLSCTAMSLGSSVTSWVFFFSLAKPSVDQKICCCLLPTLDRVNLNSNLRLLENELNENLIDWKIKIVKNRRASCYLGKKEKSLVIYLEKQDEKVPLKYAR